ncbi:MAG: hypothetical protein AAB527_03410 [Patescibacteria group bacterium]
MAQDYLPLVQCGFGQNRCTPCDLMSLANRIIDFAFKMIILPLVALGILAAGLTMLTAGGSQTQLEKGKSMLWAIIIGFFIAISAWVIINTILGNIVADGYNFLKDPFPACRQGGASPTYTPGDFFGGASGT